MECRIKCLSEIFMKMQKKNPNGINVIHEKKMEIRANIKKIKADYSTSSKVTDAAAVFSKIEALPEFSSCHSILLYWSLLDELPTHEFITKWSKSKIIFLPKVVDNELEIKKFITIETMQKSDFGILEPEAEENYEGHIDIIIVPGVAFDNDKNRLGRGKGYYDRLLSHTSAFKIGVAFDFQILNEVPVNNDDVKMDLVVSATQTIN